MAKTLVLLTDIFGAGGIQQYNKNLFSALESAFEEKEFIAISLYDSKKDICASWKNIKLICSGGFGAGLFSKINFLVNIAVCILVNRPKFIICAHIGFAPVGLILKIISKIKFAVSAHGIEVWGLKKGFKLTSLKEADLVTSVSRYTKYRMVKNGVAESKIVVLPDTVNTLFFYPKAKNESLALELGLPGKHVLLTVGRISSQEKYKGHDMMLNIMQELGDQFIWMVIGSGDDLPRLQEKAKELDIQKKVIFLKNVPEQSLPDYYNLCDVFVMPSTQEGFGIVFLEAMACGKPVVAGNRDGSAEPLMDGKLGFLVNPDSREEIAGAIRAALTLKEKRTDPCHLRNEVEANFGLAVFHKRVKGILGGVL